jgi:hypothetical protein
MKALRAKLLASQHENRLRGVWSEFDRWVKQKSVWAERKKVNRKNQE